MNWFAAANWVACIATTSLLLVAVACDRSLLVKPSIVAIACLNLLIQWGTAYAADSIESQLNDPLSFVLMSHGVPLLALLGSLHIARRTAADIWTRATSPAHAARGPERDMTIVVLLTAALTIAGLYLTFVPVERTGLYAIFFSPEVSDWVREEALKLLPYTWLKYAFSLLSGVMTPLAAALLSLKLADGVRMRRPGAVVACAALLGALMVTVSLPGTRIAASYVLLAAVVAVFYARGMPIAPGKVIPVVTAFLLIPAILSVLRNDAALTIDNLIYWMENAIIDRVFVGPTRSGIWWAIHAEANGFIGILGIPKIALLLGAEPIEYANVIALANPGSGGFIISASAVASFVFAYYAYFGLAALPLCVVAVWLLDAILPLYRRLSDGLLVPTMAAVFCSVMHLVESEYTTVLVTHGLLLIPVVALLLDFVYRRYPLAAAPGPGGSELERPNSAAGSATA